MKQVIINAEPTSVPLVLERTAAIIIDMQRDFLEPGGFGETLGNDVSLLRSAIAPCKPLLEGLRAVGHVRHARLPARLRLLADARALHRQRPVLWVAAESVAQQLHDDL